MTRRAFRTVTTNNLKALQIGVLRRINLGAPRMRNISFRGTDLCSTSMLGVLVLLVR